MESFQKKARWHKKIVVVIYQAVFSPLIQHQISTSVFKGHCSFKDDIS